LRWVQLFCDILTPKIVQHHDGMADALRIKGTGLGVDRICLMPIGNRVKPLLVRRCSGRTEGWLFPSNHSGAGHLTTVGKLYRAAREKAGLQKELVLYSSRHDYGTRVLRKTGNLAAVMKCTGHKDVRTAMRYQHQELDIVRDALNATQTMTIQ
jgi:integrase